VHGTRAEAKRFGRLRPDKNTLKRGDGEAINGNSTAADPTRRGLFAHGLGT